MHLMTNSEDSDQLASKSTDLHLHSLQRQDIARFSRTRVKTKMIKPEQKKKKRYLSEICSAHFISFLLDHWMTSFFSWTKTVRACWFYEKGHSTIV